MSVLSALSMGLAMASVMNAVGLDPAACPLQAQGVATQAIDASLARVFRDLRAAEIAGDLKGLDAATAGADARARAELARAAIARRAAARTGAELARAEAVIESDRARLAGELAARDADCAAELLLECAEDLLLRRIAADGGDAMVAIGLPTADERAAVAEAAARAGAHLRSPLLAGSHAEGAALATDARAFRWHLLAGLAALAEADCAAAGGDDAAAAAARSTGGALLARAARSELPVTAELSAVLALAQLGAGVPLEERGPLAARAMQTKDATRRFMAEVRIWTGAEKETVFPVPSGPDGAAPLLAATAEIRARVARGDGDGTLRAAVDRALAQPGTGTAQLGMGTAQLGMGTAQLGMGTAQPGMGTAQPGMGTALAPAIAARLDARARRAMADGEAPALLVALAALHPEGRSLLVERADALLGIAGDPRVAPWLALPLATELQKSGEPRKAIAALLCFAQPPGVADDAAADALGIALELARVEAMRDAEGEALLDRVYAAAMARFPRGATGVRQLSAWMLERLDLAIDPRWTPADPDRAAGILQAIPRTPETRNALDLRAAEIAALRAGGNPQAALAVARSAGAVVDACGPQERALSARAEALRAEMLLAADRAAEGLACARIALSETTAERRALLRAARAWIAAWTRLGGDDAPPESLAAMADREASVRTLIDDAAASVASRVESAVVEQLPEAGRAPARARLASIARALAAGTAIRARADALVALASGRAEEAAEQADRASKRWPSDRSLRWIQAEAIRARIAADPAMRERAFAMFRELSPLATRDRDAVWWRSQLGQLELLADDPARAREALARINRLATLDASLGGGATERRFGVLRATLTRTVGGTP